MKHAIVFLSTVLCVAASARAGVRFVVEQPAVEQSKPVAGRLIVFCTNMKSSVADKDPADGPYWQDPQPMFGKDVSTRESEWVIDDNALTFDNVASKLPPGKYKAQAVFDCRHENSSWRREAGNFLGEPVEFEVKADAAVFDVKLNLANAVKVEEPKDGANVKFIRIKSKLLGDFRRRDVYLNAGVVLPTNYDPARKYAAVYEVPGFGGDHTDAARAARQRGQMNTPITGRLTDNSFYIMLDPESPNGHTLFADSRVNGPCGEALVRELIPELEKQFPLVAKPEARVLRGHSSGGWATLWLAMNYPDVFGACFSSSPDPVDFRKLELIDIYNQPNAYYETNADGTRGAEISSTRTRGRSTLSVRQENLQEEILNPLNTSGGQWDSWQAVFGTPGANGFPKMLYDERTGVIDQAEAKQYEKYDLRLLLHNDPKRYAPILRDHIRLIVGDADDYYLNEAVVLLKRELDGLPNDGPKDKQFGYVKFVPRADHSNIYASAALRDFTNQMVEHLERNGLIVQSSTTPTTRP